MARYTKVVAQEIKRLTEMGLKSPFTPESLDRELSKEIKDPKQMDQIIQVLSAKNLLDLEVVQDEAPVKEELKKESSFIDEIETSDEKDDDYSSLVSSDANPVAYYLSQISQAALLSREEEQTLAKKIESGKQELISAILHSPSAIDSFSEKIQPVLNSELDIEEIIDGTEKLSKKAKTKKVEELKTFHRKMMHLRGRLEKMDKRKIASEKDKIQELSQAMRFNIEVIKSLITTLKTQELGSGFGNRVIEAEKEIDEAKKVLTSANLRLVSSVAKKYRHHQLTFLDLMQEGTFGLIKAVEKFDYREGTKFSTYATWWIRQAVSRSIADKGKTVRVPVHVNDLASQIKNIESQAMVENGSIPSASTIVAELKKKHDVTTTEDKVKQAQIASRAVVSLDAQMSSDSDSDSFGDFLADEADGVEDQIFNRQKKSQLMMILNKLVSESKKPLMNKEEVLTEQELAILKLRYGIYDEDAEKLFYIKADQTVVEVPWEVDQMVNGTKTKVPVRAGMKFIVNEIARDQLGMPRIDALGNPVQEIKEYTLQVGNIAQVDGKKIAITADIEEQTLEEIGQVMSRTRERIRQIEAKALEKLQSPSVLALFSELE